MPVEERLLQRVDQLISKADEVRRTHKPNPPPFIDYPTLDYGAFAEWRAQAHSFLTNLLGEEDVYVKNFTERVIAAYVGQLDMGQGILRAVKEDIEGGYLTDVRTLISAEVFTDFLEMAEHLHESGYIHPAASLAGAVLEDGMRKIAIANNITVRSGDDLSSLNQKLANARVYNRLKQQQLQPFIRIRNHADHGEFDEYSADDVAGMISGVRTFLADYLR